MKIIFLLLSIHFLLLSATPCCFDDPFSFESETESTAGHTDHEDEQGRQCSPFFTCGSCSGFIFYPYEPINVSSSSAKYSAFYPSEVKHDNCVQIWKPPELC